VTRRAILILATLIFLAGGTEALADGGGPPIEYCDIVGTPGSDHLVGQSADREFICGLGGDDVIEAMGGDDLLSGGGGADLLIGSDEGLGDEIIGGPGDDVLRGRSGMDTLLGGMGDDHIFGGSQTDLAYGGSGNDALFGWMDDPADPGDRRGVGSDHLLGGRGQDCLDVADGDNLDGVEGGRGRHDLAVVDRDDATWTLETVVRVNSGLGCEPLD